MIFWNISKKLKFFENWTNNKCSDCSVYDDVKKKKLKKKIQKKKKKKKKKRWNK